MSRYRDRKFHGKMRRLTLTDRKQRMARNVRRKRALRLWEKKTIVKSKKKGRK